MTFARFEVTSFSGVGTLEVVTADGSRVYAAGEQGRLWTGVWARQRGRPSLVIDGYAAELHEGTGPYRRPSLRLIQGGKA